MTLLYVAGFAACALLIGSSLIAGYRIVRRG